MELTTGDVVRLSGVGPKKLRMLCERGVLLPVRGGEGAGFFRYFKVVDVVALTYAAKYMAMGYADALTDKIVLALACLTEEEMLAQFAKGKKYLFPRGDVPMKLSKLPGPHNSAFNIEMIYKDVRRAIAQRVREGGAIAVGGQRGRRRGLAAAGTKQRSN
jgi:hypothetical protein